MMSKIDNMCKTLGMLPLTLHLLHILGIILFIFKRDLIFLKI